MDVPLTDWGLSAIFLALKRASAFAIGLPTMTGVAAEGVFPTGGVCIRGGRQLGGSGA